MLEERLYRDRTASEVAYGTVKALSLDKRRVMVVLTSDQRLVPCTAGPEVEMDLKVGGSVMVASTDKFASGVVIRAGLLPSLGAVKVLIEV